MIMIHGNILCAGMPFILYFNNYLLFVLFVVLTRCCHAWGFVQGGFDKWMTIRVEVSVETCPGGGICFTLSRWTAGPLDRSIEDRSYQSGRCISYYIKLR